MSMQKEMQPQHPTVVHLGGKDLASVGGEGIHELLMEELEWIAQMFPNSDGLVPDFRDLFIFMFFLQDAICPLVLFPFPIRVQSSLP